MRRNIQARAAHFVRRPSTTAMTHLPFACVSTLKGEVAETSAAAGGVIVEAGGG